MAPSRQFSVGDGEVEDWISSYNAVMSRGGGDAEGAAKKGGPGCCSICCTGFSIFAALFLFVLAALMKGHFPYLHVHGDMGLMSKNVMYAGLVYLAFALVAMTFWVKGVLLLRADGGSGFQRVG